MNFNVNALLFLIKSSLYWLNTLSGITSERYVSPQLAPRHTLPSLLAMVVSRWQRVRDLDLGHIPPTPEADVLPLVQMVI